MLHWLPYGLVGAMKFSFTCQVNSHPYPVYTPFILIADRVGQLMSSKLTLLISFSASVSFRLRLRVEINDITLLGVSYLRAKYLAWFHNPFAATS